jgi:hypothetical protein
VYGLVLALIGDPSAANPALQTVSPTGYTGYGLTPSARPAAWGQLAMGFDQSLPAARRVGLADEGYNFVMSVGLLPGLELNGRLATQNLNCNMFGGANACQTPLYRDVAASFKIGHSINLAPGLVASAAFGTTDYGGAATFNRAYYAVAGLEGNTWGVHAGNSRSVSAASPLSGPFGGLQWRPHTDVAFYSEFIGRQAWVGAKAFVPAQWTPWRNARLHAGVHHTVGTHVERLSAPLTFNAGLTLQLGTQQDARPSRRITLASAALETNHQLMEQARELLRHPLAPSVITASTADIGGPGAFPPPPLTPGSTGVSPEPAATNIPTSPTTAHQLARQLAQAGLEDIRIGQGPRGDTVVRFENTVYRWNDIDALGAALAAVLSPQDEFGHAQQASMELQLSKLGIVTARLRATPSCLWLWLHRETCMAGEAVQLMVGLARGWLLDDPVRWLVQGQAPSFGRLQLRISPGMDYRVGTEYGSIDESIGVNITGQTRLWKGAHLDVSHIIPLYNSDDYRPGGYYSEFRILNRTHRMLAHQTLDLGMGHTARFAAGRVGARFQGGLAEWRWQPGDGTHRVGYQWARFDSLDGLLGKQTSVVNYRYFIRPLQTAREENAGQFWNTDRGWAFSMRNWFDDLSVTTFIRTSRFSPQAAFLSPYGSRDVHALGIEFSFPLTPRREWSNERMRLGISDRFSLGLETAVRMGGTNYLIPYHGRFAPVPLSLNGVVYNFDRMSTSYLEDNAHLIRQAFQRNLHTSSKKQAAASPTP